MLLLLGLLACGDKDPGDTGVVGDGAALEDGGAADGGAADGGAADGGAADGGGEDGGAGDGGAELGVGERCVLPAAPPPADGRVDLEAAFPELSLSLPVHVELGPDGRWWVVQQQRGISSFIDDPGVSELESALDLSARIVSGYEAGVIGFALAPDFADSGQAYVVYTTSAEPPVALTWVLSRFTSSDGRSFDPDSEQVLLTLDQPYTNHNGGALRFGPDGMLYVAVGDGGSGGDPLGNGQDPFTLFGALLRLDVSGGGDAYAVPDDNPFADGLLGAAEVYAWGLRNVWGYSFDAATGELWAGDVGQDAWEEVDRIESGGNYGWNQLEGTHCYERGCDPAGTVLPVAEYDHSQGESITGGVVYRGSALDLYGQYLFADFISGRLWSLAQDVDSGGWEETEQLDADHYWSAFAEDADGEVILASLYDGSLWRVVPTSEEPGEDDFPQLLSETGCVLPDDPSTVSEGLLPYDVAHPFWADGAGKGRWLSLPEGEAATVGEDGDLELPEGSVVLKDFELDGRRFETRLLALHEDGSWAGYSFRWREDGSDAELLPGSLREEIGGQTWHYPSGAECMQCHTSVAGRSLGLELRQLGEQADSWQAAGLLVGSLEAEPLAGRDDSDLEAAARSYLHVNCSMCHRPEGPAPGSLDLRVDTTLGETGLCSAPTEGDLGLADARIVAAGAPERSVLLARVGDLGASRMPPLGSLVVDTEGVALLEAWIAGLEACE